MIDDVNGVFNHRALMMQDHLGFDVGTRRREDDERKILRICTHRARHRRDERAVDGETTVERQGHQFDLRILVIPRR